MSGVWWRQMGVAVGVLILIVGGAAVFGLATADSPPERVDATVDKDYFTDASLLDRAALADRSGEITLADQPSRTVLISTDQPPSELEPVVRALVSHGHEVRIRSSAGGPVRPVAVSAIGGVAVSQGGSQGSAPALKTALDDVDALLVIGGSQLNPDEYDVVENFTADGGRLLIGVDPIASFGQTGAESLTSRFGITLGDGYLYNMHTNDANYLRVFAESTEASLATGLTEVVVDGAAPVWTDDGTALAVAGGETRYSATRTEGDYSVAVRLDNVVAVGDIDILSNMNYNRADNNRLLGNVLEFVTGGPDDPYDPPAEPNPGARESPVPPGGPSGSSPPPDR